MTRRILPIIFLIFVTLQATGCATTRSVNQFDSGAAEVAQTGNVLLMPAEVELYVLTATGQLQPNAEWTTNARGFINTAVSEKIASLGYAVDSFKLTNNAPDSDQIQLQKLHMAVGSSILQHSLGMGAQALPAKAGQFDYSLGSRASSLKLNSQSKYGLFVYFQDSYSSGGRVAAQIGLALLGVGISGGQQAGFASLVDLDNGDVVWFNFLHSMVGDVRNQNGANSSIGKLLNEFPARQ